MKKVARIKGLVSQPVRRRYLMANSDERSALQPAIKTESRWMIDKMRRKGYELEATVCDVFGVFVRGPARGSLQSVAVEVSEGVPS